MALDNKEHVLNTAAREFMFPVCPLCGNEFDTPFTLTSPNGFTFNVTDSKDYTRHASHLIAESLGGQWRNDNLADTHGVCNRNMVEFGLDFHCDRINSVQSAASIRDAAKKAQDFGDRAIAGEIFPEIYRIAAKKITLGTGFARRTGKTTKDRIMRAAA